MRVAQLSRDARRKGSFSVPIHTQRGVIIPLLAFDFKITVSDTDP
jgi:hypothetical protein